MNMFILAHCVQIRNSIAYLYTMCLYYSGRGHKSLVLRSARDLRNPLDICSEVDLGANRQWSRWYVWPG